MSDDPTQEEVAVEITAATTVEKVESNESESSKPKLDGNFYLQYDETSVNEAITNYVRMKQSTKYPRPFLDTSQLFPKEDWYWHSKVSPGVDDEEWNDSLCPCMSNENRKNCGFTKNFTQRIRRAFFVAITPAVYLTIATYMEVPLNIIIGAGLWTMFSFYMLQVLYYVLSSNSTEDNEMVLYRVYSVSDKPENWADLNTAYLQLTYHEESIQSISELSAIHGGITKTLLNTLGAYVWCAVSIHFASELYYNRCVFSWDIADLFELLGTGGIVTISIFELDPFSKAMGKFHYLGVALAALCPAGYCIQQWYIGTKFIFSVILYAVAVTGLFLFTITGWATDEAQLESKRKWDMNFALSSFMCLVPGCLKGKKVNTYSKMNIVFEATAIYLTAVALCLWLIEYNTECEVGCSGLHVDC